MNVRPESFRLFSRAAMTLLLSVLTTMTAWANDAVTYIDMDGKTKTVTEYTEVTTDMTANGYGNINWSSGTYVVKSSVTLDGCIRFDYPVVIDLIVCDGATLTVNGTSNGAFDGNTLNIYAQSNGTGMGVVNVKKQTKCNQLNIAGGKVTLDADGKSYGLYVFSGDANGLTVNGGDVTIQNSDDSYGAIHFAGWGFVTLNGGKLTVTNSMGNDYMAIEGQDTNTINFNGGTAVINGRIRYFNNINLNGGNVTVNGEIDNRYGYTVTYDFTRATDSYYINAFSNDLNPGKTRTVQVKDGATFRCNGNTYSGTLSYDQIAAISNQTMTPDISAAFSKDSDTEYTIHTAKGWELFCLALQDNDTYNRFSGKTVKLGNNIGTAQDPITRMAGSDGHEFQGNFDGGGNTLTFTVTTATDNYCAPFRNVKGGSDEDHAITISNLNVKTNITATDYRHMAGLIALQWGHVNVSGCNATVTISSTGISNNSHDLYPAGLVSQASSSDGGTLTVTGCTASGTISTDGKYAAGLVGIVQGTASISDCISSVTIDSSTSGDGTHGGIVAVVTGSGSIEGCVFNGKLLSKNTGNDATTNCAGFVAWGNGTISNCLYAPANIDTEHGETEVLTGDVNNYPSGTFYRGTAPTVSNCYYTRTLGTAQGKAPHTVTPGADVTIEAVALTGTPTQYTVSGITAYSGGGLQLGETLYYGSGDQLSLTLSNSATGAPLGYQYGYTASAGTLSGSTLTMPDQDVTISVNTDHLASTGQPVAVAYVDADGTLHDGDDAAQAVALDGSETSLGTYGKEKWYFVGTNISHTGEIDCYGNVHIILCDGKTMTVDGNGSNALWSPFGNFYFYGQNGQTGTLNATGCIDAADNNAGTLTINGGIINATGDYGISAYGLIINRGTVTATATNGTGIWSGGNITLGWSKPTDRISITASSYYGTVAVASGKKLHNGSDYLGGTLSDPAAALNGKTLRPAATATYTTADGTAATADAILLDGSDNSLPAGNYLATGTLNYTHGITLTGNVTLILADNCHMNVGTSGERINGKGIAHSGFPTLTITSEANGSGNGNGALNIYTTGSGNHGIITGAITINGGNVTADTDGYIAVALYAADTDLTINGGTVSATVTGSSANAINAYGNVNYNGGNVTATAAKFYAISAYGNYTFSWRNAADRITIGATGLNVTDGTTATFTKAMTDGTTAYSTTLTGDELNALKDKTLQPCAVATFAPEGFATYYHGMFDVTLPEGVKARIVTARVDDEGTLTYQTIADGDTDAKVVPAGTAVMLQTAKSTQSQQKTLLFGIHGNNSPAAPAANFLHGSDTEGLTTGDGKHYKLSYDTQGNDIGWYWGAADGAAFQSGAHKAWLVLPDGANARFFTLPDWETTGVKEVIGVNEVIEFNDNSWYTLDGRKLSDKPTKAGLYINNGHKVVIK